MSIYCVSPLWFVSVDRMRRDTTRNDVRSATFPELLLLTSPNECWAVGTEDVYSGGGKSKRNNIKSSYCKRHQHTSFFPFLFWVPGNVSVHKSGSEGENNINFQFIFCLSQKWEQSDDAARTHEPEYLQITKKKKMHTLYYFFFFTFSPSKHLIAVWESQKSAQAVRIKSCMRARLGWKSRPERAQSLLICSATRCGTPSSGTSRCQDLHAESGTCSLIPRIPGPHTHSSLTPDTQHTGLFWHPRILHLLKSQNKNATCLREVNSQMWAVGCKDTIYIIHWLWRPVNTGITYIFLASGWLDRERMAHGGYIKWKKKRKYSE